MMMYNNFDVAIRPVVNGWIVRLGMRYNGELVYTDFDKMMADVTEFLESDNPAEVEASHIKKGQNSKKLKIRLTVDSATASA